MDKHTPTPWRIGKRSNLVVSGRTTVADCPYTHSLSNYRTLPSGGECRANAELIVRAVNGYAVLAAENARLREALKPFSEAGAAIPIHWAGDVPLIRQVKAGLRHPPVDAYRAAAKAMGGGK